jgi:co-chaperonin GroES (HSP10)
MANKVKYKPRNDNVLIRLVRRDKVGGIAVPQVSSEGRSYVVEGLGPKVEGLALGNQVMMTGQVKVDWDFLPGETDLLIIRQENVLCVIEEGT